MEFEVNCLTMTLVSEKIMFRFSYVLFSPNASSFSWTHLSRMEPYRPPWMHLRSLIPWGSWNWQKSILPFFLLLIPKWLQPNRPRIAGFLYFVGGRCSPTWPSSCPRSQPWWSTPSRGARPWTRANSAATFTHGGTPLGPESAAQPAARGFPGVAFNKGIVTAMASKFADSCSTKARAPCAASDMDNTFNVVVGGFVCVVNVNRGMAGAAGLVTWTTSLMAPMIVISSKRTKGLYYLAISSIFLDAI